MNFAELQDDARKKTFRLLILYVVGVILLGLMAVVITHAVLAPYPAHMPGQSPDSVGFLEAVAEELKPARLLETLSSQRLFITLSVFLGFLALTGGGKYLLLRSGGRKVAEALNGRHVTPDTADPRERVLLNVVEEMALASGVPPPPVYVLDNEEGINAFAAGHTIDDAVVGVTRGTLTLLNRDELQAVIAHEFSHIFNGDMRLNLRFAALLYGMLCIMQIARIFMHSMRFGGRSRDRGGQAMMVVVLVVFVTGALMAFWGRIMQAAINRQREYLADASSVQFTRSLALASALKKIGGAQSGSVLTSVTDLSYNHFFFCRADSSLLSTHPPLDKRILRLDPSWDGRYTAAVAAEE